PTSFSPDAILKHVTILIVTGDQALALASEVAFQNVLVVMRPKTRKSELPTRTTVRTRITNEYVLYLDGL
ncbi:hypothetical protein K466DRAFT_470848, partial [Polyporus arcularius HHB13444]